MPKQFIRIVNWTRFQHYKDRNPPWIKLHQELLTSQTWVTGDDATRSLAIVCMLLASRTDNKIPLDPGYIQRVGYLHRKPDLSQLLATQFIEIVDEAEAASGMQASASRLHANARPETETEVETETEKSRVEKTHTETLKSISAKTDSVKPISVKSATETLQSGSQNPAICDKAIRKNRQEPSLEPSSVSMHHPTLEDVTAYCRERRNRVNPQRWFDYYVSNGWKVGRNPMKDWKAAVRTWEQNGENYGNGNGNGNRQAGLLANRDAARQGIMARRPVDRTG